MTLTEAIVFELLQGDEHGSRGESIAGRVMTIIRVNDDGPQGGILVVCPKQDLLGFYRPF
jgi:hypothetical protein